MLAKQVMPVSQFSDRATKANSRGSEMIFTHKSEFNRDIFANYRDVGLNPEQRLSGRKVGS